MKPTITPRNKFHLRVLIQTEINENGYKCNLNHIDVSNITDMRDLFSFSEFNGDISKWNVSKVEDMSFMFSNSKFDGDISNWNVSNVINMEKMFFQSEFNGDISKWNVLKVLRMRAMFANSKFNQNISKWNVNNLNDMDEMFNESLFNQDLANWKPYSLIIHYSSNIFKKSCVPIPYWHDFENIKERKDAIDNYCAVDYLKKQLEQQLPINNNQEKKLKI